jgi:glycosyltransferase involved in cell wall biosynthesis
MPKTLYASPNGFIGGAEKFVIQASVGHHQLQPESVVTLFFSGGKAPEILKQNGVPVYIIKNSFRLSRPFKLIKACLEVRSLVKKEKIEIIHSTMAYGHLFMSLATIGIKLKKIWFQHGPVDGILDKLASLFKADVILFNSEYLKEMHLNSNFNFHRSEMACIRLGVPQVQHRERESSIPLHLLMIGRLSPIKGFHIVLEGIRLLQNRRPDLSQFLQVKIIGDANFEHEKEYEKKLMNLAKDLSQIVNFIPFQQNLDSLYESGDILIQPSLIGEGFGLVLAEAMSHELLVISPVYGGGTQIVLNNKTGLNFNFLEDKSEVKLADLIEKIIDNFSQYKEMRKNGLELITNQYTEKVMMQDLLSHT